MLLDFYILTAVIIRGDGEHNLKDIISLVLS